MSVTVKLLGERWQKINGVEKCMSVCVCEISTCTAGVMGIRLSSPYRVCLCVCVCGGVLEWERERKRERAYLSTKHQTVLTPCRSQYTGCDTRILSLSLSPSHTHTHTRTHTRAHTRARAHTHTHLLAHTMINLYSESPEQDWVQLYINDKLVFNVFFTSNQMRIHRSLGEAIPYF